MLPPVSPPSPSPSPSPSFVGLIWVYEYAGRPAALIAETLLRTSVHMVCTLVHMGYALLAGAIAAEVAATTAMKYSDGFSRLWPSLLTVIGYVIAFALLAQTLKSVSVGTAYAIWAGVGTAIVAAIGMVFLGEGLNAAKVAGIALIIGGVVVLNLGGAH
jgi:small multidrug resistance pump